jgi:hypothetical protein
MFYPYRLIKQGRVYVELFSRMSSSNFSTSTSTSTLYSVHSIMNITQRRGLLVQGWLVIEWRMKSTSKANDESRGCEHGSTILLPPRSPLRPFYPSHWKDRMYTQGVTFVKISTCHWGKWLLKSTCPKFFVACRLMFKHFKRIKFALIIPFPPLLFVCMYYIHTLVYIIVADLKK